MWTMNFQMFKLDLEKAEEQEIKMQHLLHHRKSKRFQKNLYFCFIDYAKAFDCMDHNKLENSQRNGNTRPPYLPSEKSVWRSWSNVIAGESFPEGWMSWPHSLLTETEVVAEGAEGLPPLCGAHRGLQCLLLFYSKVLSNPGLKKKMMLIHV